MIRPLLLILLWLLPSAAQADDGLVTTQSAHSGPATVQRIQEALTTKGWTILATIDHAAHAAQWGVKIPFRTTIDFAYLPAWTRLLIESPTVAMEVPIPILVWEDREGVWVTRNTAQYYLRKVLPRHEAKAMPGPTEVFSNVVDSIIINATR